MFAWPGRGGGGRKGGKMISDKVIFQHSKTSLIFIKARNLRSRIHASMIN